MALNHEIGVRIPAPQQRFLCLRLLSFSAILSLTMKSAFTTLLIISFLGVAVFGFVSMIFGAQHNGGCIASKFGSLCPLNNPLAFVIFHLGAFKYFSTAVFGAVLLFLLFRSSFSILPKPLNGDEEDDEFIFGYNFFDFFYAFKRRLNHWLSLHTNSPSFTFAAVI